MALVTLRILKEKDLQKKEDKPAKSKHNVQLELEEEVPWLHQLSKALGLKFENSLPLLNILLSSLQHIPACHADLVQCFLVFSFKREHDTDCIIVGHCTWIWQTEPWGKMCRFWPTKPKCSSDSSSLSDSGQNIKELSTESSSPLSNIPKAIQVFRAKYLREYKLNGKKPYVFYQLHGIYVCVCLPAIGGFSVRWTVTAVHDWIQNLGPPLRWHLSNINYLSTGKKHTGLERADGNNKGTIVQEPSLQYKMMPRQFQ